MDNLSGSAENWGKDSREEPKKKEIIKENKKKKVKLDVKSEIKNINNILHSLETKYSINASKHIYDSVANLKSSLSALENVK